MTTLTEARRDLAAGLAEALGDDIPVFSVMPTNVVAPSVVVLMRGAEQTTPGMWTQTFRVICIGTGGDNLAGLESLEHTLQAAAVHLCGKYHQPAAWDAPGTLTIAGTVYLTASIEVDLTIGF